MIYGVVYLIIDGTNDKEYVGQTTKPLEVRIMQHKRSDLVVDKAIQKYGIENFRYGVIKTCASKEELDYWERYYIVALKSKVPYGYNMTDGGDGNAGWHHKPESIAKMSKKHRGKKLTPEHCENIRKSKLGEKNPFFGKHHTLKSLAQMSKTRTGKHHTKEHCDHIAAGLRGVKKSPEHCANISKSKTGQIPADETRDTMSESRRGEKNHNYRKPRAQATCVQISAKNRAESVYPNLVAEFEARKMTYSALAKILELASATVSEKMRGRKKFSDEQTAKLVAFFGKPAEYLLYRDENICLHPVTDRRISPYKNLIAELDTRNMSYPMLAELLDSTSQSIGKKMRGERTFKDSEKKRLTEIFGKPLEYLLQCFE